MDDIFLVDTHVHLDLIDNGRHISEIIERAGGQGVHAMISVGIDLKSSRNAVDYSRHHPQVFSAIGVHPNDAEGFDQDILAELITMAKSAKKVVAWGEIGLDYYRRHTPVETQQKVFEAQLEAASSLDLPVIIHDRDAHEDCLSILRSFLHTEELTGVFHCFSGDRQIARKVLDLGFFLSITGVVTFPKAEKLVDVVRFLPMDSIMVETDSPFLSPVPYRGKPNEPARARIVAEKIAQIKGLSLEEVASCTTRNAKGLFRLQLP